MAIKDYLMKKLLNIVLALALLSPVLVSCSKDESVSIKEIDSRLIGEWHMIGARTEGQEVSKDMDVYLVIHHDGGFELYQRNIQTQSERFDLYTGKCWVSDSILTGKYSDGTPWGGKWEYAMTIDGLLLKSYNLLEEQRYIKATVPAEIRENANPVTKSAGICTPIL